MSIPTNDSIQTRAPKPTDSRYLKGEMTPWTSLSEVNAAIPAAYRHQGLTVLIGTREYWYLGGTTDNHLTIKNNNDHIVQLTADGYFEAPVDMLVAAFVVTPNIDISLKIGLTAGSDNAYPETSYQASLPAVINVMIWRAAGQRIHFSGLAGSNTKIIIKTL